MRCVKGRALELPPVLGYVDVMTHAWPSPILEGKFLKRYKRFFTDIELDGQTVVAHCANTGSMKTCLFEGSRALMLGNDDPARKLKFSLQALGTPWGAWIGINTQWPNILVKKAFEDGRIPHWSEFATYKAEHKISKETRLDGLLTPKDPAGKPRFVEIKNVTLAFGDVENFKGEAKFPDAVTERGQKHLRELAALAADGHEAEMVYVIQRTDCKSFAPAEEIDPVYAQELRNAIKAGVKVSAWPVDVGPEGLRLRPDLPLEVRI